MEKIEYFKNELEYIKDLKIREFTEKAIEDMPDYFFEATSSSSGKYHPSYALGKGGLLRHTRAAVRIAVELFRMEMFNYFGEEGKDLIISSLILHDGRKFGNTEGMHTLTEHPIIQAFSMENNTEINNILPKNQFETICDNIKSHMGAWNTAPRSKKEVLPKPKGKMQNFVHLVDYIASRRCLEMNFDIEIKREEE